MKNIKHNTLSNILLVGLILVNFPLTAFSYELPSADTKINLQYDTSILKQMSKGVSAVASSAQESLVFIATSRTIKQYFIDPFDLFGFSPRKRPKQEKNKPHKQQGLGSGFFIDVKKGYILTNNHVIQDAEDITLKLANGSSYTAKVVGKDKNTDVAVLQIEDKNFNKKGISSLVLGNSDAVKVGEFVVALGAPFRLEASITFGVVSAIGRGSLQLTRYGNFIQTDAAINPGNSGGPLVDMDGKVVGINTAIYSKSGDYSGIGFSIPSNLVRRITSSLINNGRIERGFIGIGMEPLHSSWTEKLKVPKNTKGIIVTQVTPSSPAEAAKMKPWDIITAVNGKEVQGLSEFANIIGLMKPGTKIKLSFYRNGQKKSVSITIGTWPKEYDSEDSQLDNKKDKSPNPYGVTTKVINKSLRKRYSIVSKNGLVITHVVPGSAAFNARLQAGDVILNVQGREIKSPQALNKMLKNESMVLLHIEREGEFFMIAVKSNK